MAVALGLTTVIGTLGPVIFHGTLSQLLAQTSGRLTLAGIAITIAGIVVVASAGKAKERELNASAADGNGEFDLRRGFLIAIFSGVMSSCFAWGLDAGQPIRVATVAAGTPALWQGLPVLCVVLAGGLTTNLIWCAYLIWRNGSIAELIGRGDAAQKAEVSIPLLPNYLFAALGGTLWYFQFFFYTMGESQMGSYGFSSWTIHMASIILFSTLWGFALREWASASIHTRRKVWGGIALLVGATVVIGIGNMLHDH
jgi:L-rhamnose-H+ transport protein